MPAFLSHIIIDDLIPVILRPLPQTLATACVVVIFFIGARYRWSGRTCSLR